MPRDEHWLLDMLLASRDAISFRQDLPRLIGALEPVVPAEEP